MPRVSVRAGILVTGTEVLSGYVTDRNGPWMSEQLAGLGVEVEEITVVGDRPEDLEGALRHMRDQGLDLIFTSGGLGPTADDLTAEVVGTFAGRELVLDEEMEQKIADIIARYARRLRFDPEAVREANRKQAMVPEGATAIAPAGPAPRRPGGGPPRARRAGRRPGGDRPARPTARASGHVAPGARRAARPAG